MAVAYYTVLVGCINTFDFVFKVDLPVCHAIIVGCATIFNFNKKIRVILVGVIGNKICIGVPCLLVARGVSGAFNHTAKGGNQHG